MAVSGLACFIPLYRGTLYLKKFSANEQSPVTPVPATAMPIAAGLIAACGAGTIRCEKSLRESQFCYLYFSVTPLYSADGIDRAKHCHLFMIHGLPLALPVTSNIS